MAFSRIRHVFFDLDHTLWDFVSNSSRALQQLYVTHELEGRGIPNQERFLEHYVYINDQCWAKYRDGKMTKEVLRTIRFEKVLNAFGVSDKALVNAMADEYLEISPYQKGLMPGTIETLDYLRDKYVMHIITNGFEEVQHIKLEQSGLRSYFDQIITSEQVNARKPAQIIFDHSLQLARAHPEEAVMIGDNLEADILGAKGAGWKQVFYNPHGNQHGESLDFEIRHLLELKDLL